MIGIHYNNIIRVHYYIWSIAHSCRREYLVYSNHKEVNLKHTDTSGTSRQTQLNCVDETRIKFRVLHIIRKKLT